MTADGAGADAAVSGLVSAVRPAGTLDVVSLSVPGSPAWQQARPGQLVVVPGDPGRGEVLPRVLWLAGVDVDPLHGTTMEVVVPETDGYAVGQRVRVLAPLGRGFALPAQAVPVLVVAHGAAAAPVRWWVDLLRGRGCTVHVVLSADDPDALPDPGALRRAASTVLLTRPAGVGQAVGRVLSSTEVSLVLGAGPPWLVRETLHRAQGRVARVAPLDLDGPLVCGTGLCGGCDLEGRDRDGAPRTVRACLEGPVLRGSDLELTTAGGEADRAPG